MSESVSRPLTVAEQIFHDIIWNPLIMAGETALFTWAPILNAPVLGDIDKGVISVVSDYLFSQLVLFVDVTAIKFIDPAHQSAYDSASEALKIIAQEKGITSAEFLAAQAAAIKAMQSFVHLNVA